MSSESFPNIHFSEVKCTLPARLFEQANPPSSQPTLLMFWMQFLLTVGSFLLAAEFFCLELCLGVFLLTA